MLIVYLSEASLRKIIMIRCLDNPNWGTSHFKPNTLCYWYTSLVEWNTSNIVEIDLQTRALDTVERIAITSTCEKAGS